MDADAVARLRGVIAKLSRRLAVSATSEGLTPSQASALAMITWRGPLSLTDLAELEGLNPTMVSRVVGRLDELGYIERKPNPADLRAALVETTAPGRVIHERIKDERAKVVSARLDRLPTTDRELIVAALPALERLAEELR